MSYLQLLFYPVFNKKRLVSLSMPEPISALSSQQEMNQKSLVVGPMDFEQLIKSNDINEIESVIKYVRWNIVSLNVRKNSAMSIIEFYNYGKLIRVEKTKMYKALDKYVKLEQENDLPINLEYRAALKKLGK